MKDNAENTFLLAMFIIIIGIILNTTFQSSEPVADTPNIDTMFNKWRKIF